MNRELPPGIAIKMELGMRFVKWADGLRHAPTRDEVMTEFSVGQSTAYRYLTAYRNVCEAVRARDCQEFCPTHKGEGDRV